MSNCNPSLVVFQGVMYIFYPGADTQNMFVMWYNNNAFYGNCLISSLSGAGDIGYPLSESSPALAVFYDKLYLIFKGGNYLFWLWFDGSVWRGNEEIHFVGNYPVIT